MDAHIIGLGPCCITKYAINDMKFDAPTLPFDWMFSSLTCIKQILMDNFEALMKKENIRSTNPCWSKHKSYNILYNGDIRNTYNVTTHLLSKREFPDYVNFHMWNHYNLLEEEQYAKYMKYIERFRTMCASPKRKLFFYIQYYDNTIHEVLEFHTYLQTHIQNYTFVCIACMRMENASDSIVCAYNHNNLHIYTIELDRWEDTLPQSKLEHIKAKLLDIMKKEDCEQTMNTH